MLQALDLLQKNLFLRIEQKNFLGCTLTLKIKYADFQQMTRSQTGPFPIHSLQNIESIFHHLLTQINTKAKLIRLLGLTISNTEYNYQTAIQLEFTVEHHNK